MENVAEPEKEDHDKLVKIRSVPSDENSAFEQHWSVLLRNSFSCMQSNPLGLFLLVGGSGQPVSIHKTLLLRYSTLIAELYKEEPFSVTLSLDFADEKTLQLFVQILHGFTVLLTNMNQVQMIKDVFQNLGIPYKNDSFHVFPYENLGTQENGFQQQQNGEMVTVAANSETLFDSDETDFEALNDGETGETQDSQELCIETPELHEPTSVESPNPSVGSQEQSSSSSSIVVTSMSVLSQSEYNKMDKKAEPTIYNDSEFRQMISEGKIKFSPVEHQLIRQPYNNGMPRLIREKTPVPNSQPSSLPILEKQTPNSPPKLLPTTYNPKKRMRKYEKQEVYVGSKVGKNKALTEIVPFVHLYVEDEVSQPSSVIASCDQTLGNGTNQIQQQLMNGDQQIGEPRAIVRKRRNSRRRRSSNVPVQSTSTAPPQNDTSRNRSEVLITNHPIKKRKRLTDAQTSGEPVGTASPPPLEISASRLNESEIAVALAGVPFATKKQKTQREVSRKMPKRKRLSQRQTTQRDVSTLKPKRKLPAHSPATATAEMQTSCT